MKKKFILFTLLALLAGTFCSCDKNGTSNYPILYVVNGTNYTVDVYCDNHLVASVGAHNNSGAVKLNNVSVNLPVYVEADFFDSKGSRVGGYTWNNYYFKWDKSYKMTLTNSASTSTLSAL